MTTERGDILVWKFPQLKGLDIDSTKNKAYIIFYGVASCLVLFILCHCLSFNSMTYRNLRAKEKVFWCLNLVRAVFGCVGAFFGCWFTLLDSSLHDDIANETNISSFIGLQLFVGFFVFECAALYLSNIVFRSFDPFLAAHHTLSLLGGVLAAYYGKAHFIAMVALLLEMTTPFSCLCWTLIKARLAHHWVWKLNQLILVHLFHCRTTIEIFIAYKTYLQWDKVVNLPTGLLVFYLLQLSSQLLFITPYWTYKKTQQLSNPIDWNHPELKKTNGIHEHKD